MLVGQYDYAIDAKGRLNFPARFRDAMGETFIVTRWLDHCLAAFPAVEFEKVAAKIEEKGLVKGRKVSRMLYAAAVEVSDLSAVTADLAQLQLAPRQYAVIPHDGPLSDMPAVFEAIWKTWMPSSGRTYSGHPVLERYGPEFNGAAGTGGFEIWIPVKA